ncbi:MAG: dTDP-4-dehydrorhamnose reductase [Planctomycetota bacterium]|nr:dTDP-4-dehydrorhamnose reductase [Planctomycetota bacterium]
MDSRGTHLVFGATGQVGAALVRMLGERGCAVVAPTRAEADFSAPDAVGAFVARVRPQVILNAASYNFVDRAEADFATARAVNAESVREMADAARAVDARIVHYSTDYVFDGSGTEPWREDDVPAPLNAYGRSKLEGELAVRRSGARHLLLRTSWVHSATRACFVRTVLELAAARESLEMVADQICCPSSADFIAESTLNHEVFHVVPGGSVSRHAYAQEIVRVALDHGARLRLAPDAIRAVRLADRPAEAARPPNAVLSCRRLEETLEMRAPGWQAGVRETVRALVQASNA